MAWSISISIEGWEEIREACHEKSKRWLLNAINAYNRYHGVTALNRKRLKDYSRETLADEAFACIEATNTCNNGGFVYWIDPQGYYTITIK
ncbi:hypothetical protein [Chitinophaga pinensis]|uniref:Uncharacterized protein n=1 Tax=Chitinophaga pinensis (strain ATCC 43595 / DSM 2588 / LMG 13176 / NBRC 15968 / NCIMB 11800 / UQM 2034) TaxID=485918 RepID=A0A979GWT4_CHIPD|nr:hypothetical protein [Chitinophaga pinensis]ACU60695.1 hypothetical protein Cpin_3228 [Chitinophaga pinensis DSM 2588]